uniref:Uncharacterized protein n=2 Tax=Brassica oleracea TaxID=3712 RepID=A0A0D3BDB1_BRAOL
MTIYGVQREHNRRRHQKSWSTAVQVTRCIDRTMRNRISSLKYGSDHKFEELMRRWFEVTP